MKNKFQYGDKILDTKYNKEIYLVGGMNLDSYNKDFGYDRFVLVGTPQEKIKGSETQYNSPKEAQVSTTPENTPSNPVDFSTMTDDELKAIAKGKGIKSSHLMGREKLLENLKS